jgi:hypothetical protein
LPTPLGWIQNPDTCYVNLSLWLPSSIISHIAIAAIPNWSPSFCSLLSYDLYSTEYPKWDCWCVNHSSVLWILQWLLILHWAKAEVFRIPTGIHVSPLPDLNSQYSHHLTETQPHWNILPQILWNFLFRFVQGLLKCHLTRGPSLTTL